MRSRQLDEAGELRTYAVVLDRGDEVMEELTRFVGSHAIGAASITAVGAFSGATLAFFDVGENEYVDIPIGGQVELLSLVGDVALTDSEPEVHAHVVVGHIDGTTHGGHLQRGEVNPTMEAIITESPAHLRKRRDPSTGLMLIDPGFQK